MNLKKQLATKNECYIRGDKIKPTGIVVHSTGANNPYLKRYVQPDDGLLGKNIYNNSWNNFRPSGRQVCCHAFIGKLESGAIATYQTLPFETRGWHAGSGKNGSANDGYIGFEICEDNTQNADYAKQTYQEAVEFCAYLVKLYPAIKYENIIGHYEAAARGIASGHADPQHWWKKHKLSMAQFRKDVKSKVEAEAKPKPVPATDVLYRVQVGAFKNKNYADKMLADLSNLAYFKDKGIVPYIVTAEDRTTTAARSAKVTATQGLNIRDKPNGKKIGALNFGAVVSISEEKSGWGKLADRDGWISTDYVESVR